MDYSMPLYVGIGCGLGVLVGHILKRAFRIENEKLSAFFVMIPMVLVWQGTVALYKNMYLPRIVPMDTSELDESVPAMAVIREAWPEKYKDMIRPIDKAVRQGKTSPDTLNEFRSQIVPLIDEKKATIPLAMARREITISIDLFEQMKIKNPVVCTHKLYNRPYGDLSSDLSSEYQEKEGQLMAAILASDPSDDYRDANAVAGETQIQSIFNQVIADLDLTDVDPDENDLAGHKKICDFHIQANQVILQLGDQEFANVWASIFKQ